MDLQMELSNSILTSFFFSSPNWDFLPLSSSFKRLLGRFPIDPVLCFLILYSPLGVSVLSVHQHRCLITFTICPSIYLSPMSLFFAPALSTSLNLSLPHIQYLSLLIVVLGWWFLCVNLSLSLSSSVPSSASVSLSLFLFFLCLFLSTFPIIFLCFLFLPAIFFFEAKLNKNDSASHNSQERPSGMREV